ncbi:hypothetical protein Q1695_004360 [Nippostrongylus brasiliensis]|nr:hypothetical protein Q1695_004360 [Nippostrongylus brasiliensis]
MPCRGAYHKISRAIASVVSATIKVHPNKKKKARVKRIFRDFYTRFPNRPLDAANEAYEQKGQKAALENDRGASSPFAGTDGGHRIARLRPPVPSPHIGSMLPPGPKTSPVP